MIERGIFMKNVYEMPMAYAESFAANEYVAACYFLACERGIKGVSMDQQNKWSENEFGYDIRHESSMAGTCSDRNANRVISDTGFLDASQVGEYNKDQGWINGGIDTWDDTNHNNKLDVGEVIFWHTYNKGKSRRWNHWGTLQSEDSNHPNHS